jgi:hypothetical protein
MGRVATNLVTDSNSRTSCFRVVREVTQELKYLCLVLPYLGIILTKDKSKVCYLTYLNNLFIAGQYAYSIHLLLFC